MTDYTVPGMPARLKNLPDGLIAYGRTPLFTQDSIPPKLRHGHTTKSGSWAKIHIVSGSLRYRILGDVPEEQILGPAVPGIIEPDVLHVIEPLGEVQLYLEFFRSPDHGVVN